MKNADFMIHSQYIKDGLVDTDNMCYGLVCVCVVIPVILDVRFVDVLAGFTQDLSSTFLLRCLP